MTSLDKKDAGNVQEELKWIRLKYPDEGEQKLESKLLNNPFVPIGATATVVALVLGVRNFYKSDSAKQQLMMRCRVAAQGFTVVAILCVIKGYVRLLTPFVVTFSEDLWILKPLHVHWTLKGPPHHHEHDFGN